MARPRPTRGARSHRGFSPGQSAIFGFHPNIARRPKKRGLQTQASRTERLLLDGARSWQSPRKRRDFHPGPGTPRNRNSRRNAGSAPATAIIAHRGSQAHYRHTTTPETAHGAGPSPCRHRGCSRLSRLLFQREPGARPRNPLRHPDCQYERKAQHGHRRASPRRKGGPV